MAANDYYDPRIFNQREYLRGANDARKGVKSEEYDWSNKHFYKTGWDFEENSIQNLFKKVKD